MRAHGVIENLIKVNIRPPLSPCHWHITADCCGSNGYRVHLWCVQLQILADELDLTIQICHLPPGTSKWNKIEHRMFCHITNNWRGRSSQPRSGGQPDRSHERLRIQAQLDENTYEAGTRYPTRNSLPSPLSATCFTTNGTTRLRPRGHPRAC
ncbi:MAG: hypothetical protein HQL73_03065 [Magnetococcales bacterium]|nr:hypothetical protein [Magnetococcales bacterium]